MKAAHVVHHKSGEVSICIDEQVTSITPPWKLSETCSGLQRIVSDNHLQYLSSMEAEAAMLDWYNALDIEGKLEIILPDLDYYLQLWQKAVWDEKNLRDMDSEARLAFAGLFGAQIDANPRSDKYSGLYHDCHKSGYNKARLNFLMQRAGFVRVSVAQEAGRLIAKGVKTMHKGERQVTPSYENIRQDHKERYQFACEQLKPLKPNSILDLACGIGYGSLMLNEQTGSEVIGVDIDKGAIDYANTYYSGERTRFICQDARKLEIPEGKMDAVVSFETIEHIDFDRQLLSVFYSCLRPGGVLICSTPNQDVMPFDKNRFAFHIKHYTVSEVVDLLQSCGFSDIRLFKQEDAKAAPVTPGNDGCFTIAVARR
ncbi:class I SAM-dependent methyltransferase [Lacimicrobium alkaliphilum]|uniref:Methyltransferase domain-containing protein n=1 Tax=Lacimicrobium alkaliphilum TaxID=1526571 RepID=A0ABQ1RK49_9ALTE|nr:methyltransferase domain-containing protein [Lacimicrobium alkaliphilum]GGD72496.1 hypothetical protein GCM10011357_29370 [Lacimicrobium alkaliphilum]